jgi:negative regulator of sigma-B (phosphoserine phosphatase)
MVAAMTAQLLEWGVATLALPGEAESGDLHLVEPFKDGALVAVVDGLGHGSEAAVAAKIAVATLKEHPQESVITLVKRCNEILRPTRGVVLSMAAFNALEGTMTWLGVGNVEGILLRADSEGKPTYESLLLRRGVVGGRLPPLYATILPVSRGDTLVLVTDGIRSGYESRWSSRGTPQQTADQILAQHNMETDDALVLVARYLGKTL